MTLFSPKLWADKMLEALNVGAMHPTLLPMGNPTELFFVKMNPDLEAFFVALALEHGTHPEPTFGVQRNDLARTLTVAISEHPGAPFVLRQLRRNFTELGGRVLDKDSDFFYAKIADAYLDWLYSQPESMALMPEALEKYTRSMGTWGPTFLGVYGQKGIKP